VTDRLIPEFPDRNANLANVGLIIVPKRSRYDQNATLPAESRLLKAQSKDTGM
jgi:hypothetical protein